MGSNVASCEQEERSWRRSQANDDEGGGERKNQEAHTVAAALSMLLLPTFNPSPAIIDSSPLPLLT